MEAIFTFFDTTDISDTTDTKNSRYNPRPLKSNTNSKVNNNLGANWEAISIPENKREAIDTKSVGTIREKSKHPRDTG